MTAAMIGLILAALAVALFLWWGKYCDANI
jgi:hypothetical protein